jgi:cellulose synthase/poly-beta-1,6-N-acetylglucosamine synthase-like glycosyltransferase
MRTIAALVPAYNEEEGLGDTLQSLLSQSLPFDEIIVVDDCSTDRTREIALSYGVTCVTPPSNLGSKAKAQNYGLDHVSTELVLPVDADTLLAPDYVELMQPVFDDPQVEVAAGCVQTRFTNTTWEKGRQIEYLFGFHWHRPIQNVANSPVVCSGCCSVFRVDTLKNFGGFPERTIVEDMDYTWSQQIAGKKAVYVGDAVAWAADPTTALYLRKQVWRWMAGFFQNVRIHYRELLVAKKMLAMWVTLAVLEILTAPLWYIAPVLFPFLFDVSFQSTMMWWLVAEVTIMTPPLVYAARRRNLPLWSVLSHIPNVYLNKAINIWYAWKALAVELIGVPLGLTVGLVVYEKGRADTPAEELAA